jgi:RNA polymerase sigma-70 factor (ECF subfamily)
VGPDAADGLVGEAFKIAFEHRARFDATWSSARPWLYGIATHLLAHHQRAEARRLRATAQLAAQRLLHEEFEQRAAEILDARARWRRVAETVAALPAADRDALLLFAWEELSYADIALALCVPVGTVRSRINRARRTVRALLADEAEFNDD